MPDPVETINALAAQGRIEIPPTPRPPSLMDVIATAGVDKLPMLWELYERQQKMDAEKAFNQAMAAVQEKMQPVLKEAENPSTRSKYARLVDIDRAIRPIYSEFGLSLTFTSGPATRSQSGVLVCCDVRHVGGHVKVYQLEGELDNIGAKGSPTKTAIHGLGSTISYLRRYLTVMIFNIPLTDDDDGNGGHEQGEPVYRHGGWAGSGSQADADEVGRRRIEELENRQADLKAGCKPRTAEPSLAEGLQASVKSKNWRMLKEFRELRKQYKDLEHEEYYYGILGQYGVCHSNEFPEDTAGMKLARQCYRAMGKDLGALRESVAVIARIPEDRRFEGEWPDNAPEDGLPFLFNGIVYRFNEERGNFQASQ